MSFLDTLFGSNPIGAVVDSTLGKVVDKALDFIPDPVQKAAAALAIQQLNFDQEKIELDAQTAAMSQQMAVNLEEAKSEKWWKAGARPFFMWVCGLAFAYAFVLQPFMTFFVKIWIKDFNPPTLDIQSLLAIASTMLGLGYLRSGDKQAITAAKSGN